MQFNRHLEFKACVRAQVKAGVKDAFGKAPDRAMVKARVKAVLQMSIELLESHFLATLIATKERQLQHAHDVFATCLPARIGRY